MTLANKLSIKRKDGTFIRYKTVTQLYTIGNHIVVVAEEAKDIYTTEKHIIIELERMEVEF